MTTSAANVGCLRSSGSELMSWSLSFRHRGTIRKGESYLDTVFQEAVTPGRVTTVNSVSGQGQKGVTACEAGGGILQKEPQPLTLSNRYEALAPSADEEQGCRKDESADHGSGGHSRGGSKKAGCSCWDFIIRGIDSILCEQDRESPHGMLPAWCQDAGHL